MIPRVCSPLLRRKQEKELSIERRQLTMARRRICKTRRKVASWNSAWEIASGPANDTVSMLTIAETPWGPGTGMTLQTSSGLQLERSLRSRKHAPALEGVRVCVSPAKAPMLWSASCQSCVCGIWAGHSAFAPGLRSIGSCAAFAEEKEEDSKQEEKTERKTKKGQ